eukprot:CAMPEP_0177592062 /NCGR_PEP_ID=MMETSP0419_2-20121207/8348_1 /TAXON_ID=582737 /ORGANISM="Tetraselmis sp., Strain GSL018" /LENGTH=153 /DNA_ID=CAMNT_0019082881 /DNA_START=1399 /DNA_END=1856 /DNA_ORIENTATION=-
MSSQQRAGAGRQESPPLSVAPPRGPPSESCIVPPRGPRRRVPGARDMAFSQGGRRGPCLEVEGLEPRVQLELHAEALPDRPILRVLPRRVRPLEQAELCDDLRDQDVVLRHEAEEVLLPYREGARPLHLPVEAAEDLEAAVDLAVGAGGGAGG